MASGRPNLWDRIIGLRAAAERYTRLGYNLPSVDMHDAVRSHRGLLLAMESHDGDLAKAMTGNDLTRTFHAVYDELIEQTE